MITKAKYVTGIIVTDPDTQGLVELEVYKHQNGSIFAIDSSFVDQAADTNRYGIPIIQDPFEDGAKVKLT